MFYDRIDAAQRLAGLLRAYKGARDAVVLAIPRGGVVTGAVLARELGLPLDIILTKKIGHPDNPEFAIGVVNLRHASIDQRFVESERIPRSYIEKQIKTIRAALQRRYDTYLGGRRQLPLEGETVIITDDGVATGHTLLAAIRLARDEKAKRIVAAVPVGAPDTMETIRRIADETVCLSEPENFMAIGQFYERFEQVDDAEAIRLLAEAAAATR